ncbi:MAG: glycoside hydrolase family 2 TIM barrel-domain containing protein [Planctomycetota bacterium]
MSRWFTPLFVLAFACSFHTPSYAATVTVESHADGHRLLVDGEPYVIKGGGGDSSKPALVAAGGNTTRTWGAGDDLMPKLEEAQQLGLKVLVGIWLGHERHGFNYDDPAQVQKQFEEAKAAVLQHKDHPAVLAWGVGNEMEGYEDGGNPKIWKAVDDIAKMIKDLDPNHPTFTVTAEIGGERVRAMHELTPHIDMVGINTYGGVHSIPERYRAAGGTKPYLVTEFGPPGTWEQSNNDWGVPLEKTSTEKADIYKSAYDALHADPLCVGSVAFTWGFKQEATATWFGMFLPDGSKLGAVDAMTEAWTGKPPADLSPVIDSLEIVGNNSVPPQGKITARLKAHDPEGRTLDVDWILKKEDKDTITGGDFRPAMPSFPAAIVSSSAERVELQMPRKPGEYRLFAFVRDGRGGAATANAPLRVTGASSDDYFGADVQLPLVVYGDNMPGGAPYTPSGYMGDAQAITIDEASTDRPHAGATCLKATFANPGGWGGVVWQSPANDWGEKPGGFDLSGATRLSFWARGSTGGEKVKIGFGILGRDAKFYDTAKSEREFTLTRQWKQFSFDLAGKDLACIKSGFYWVVAGQGKPLTFYFDDIVFETVGSADEPG